MLKSLKWFNEKGNVSVKVRDSVRSQVDGKLAELIAENFDGVVTNANGGYSIPVAVDEASGKTIYATISFVINTADPSEKAVRKTAKKAVAEEPEVPDLF